MSHTPKIVFVGSNASSWYVTYMWSTIKNTLLIIFPELSFEKKFIPKISLKNLEKWIFRRKNKKNQKWAFEYLIIKIHFSRFFNEILGINFFSHDDSKKIIKILGFFWQKSYRWPWGVPLRWVAALWRPYPSCLQLCRGPYLYDWWYILTLVSIVRPWPLFPPP